MDEEQFEKFILVPALTAVCLYSLSAHILILGTFIVESNLRLVEQKGPGDAMGLGQMEKVTYDGILKYLNRIDKANLKEICLSACFYVSFPPRSALMHNLRWAVITSRLKYLPIRRSLPAWDDAEGMCEYHKKFYNTLGGATDVEKSIKVFERIINERKDRFKGQS